jgi:hypothetical protein
MGEMFRGFNESMIDLQGRTDQGPQGVKESFYRQVFEDPLIPGGLKTDEFPRYGIIHRRPGWVPGSNTSCEPIRRVTGTGFHTTPGANHVFSVKAKIMLLLRSSVFPITILGHLEFLRAMPFLWALRL